MSPPLQGRRDTPDSAVLGGAPRVSDACVLIGVERRQVFRLLHGLKQDGATNLLSERRGRPSNLRRFFSS
jgi:Winged helix-turn helix